MRALAMALALAALLPAALRAQTPDEQIRATLERAATSGVPVELVQSKVDEGRAKGIAPDRIAAAAALRLDALTRLRERLAEAHPTAAELGAAADAAAVGASADQIARLVAAAGDRRAVALVVLTHLVQLGHGADDALARVLDALTKGPSALLELPDHVAVADARRAQNGTGGSRSGAPAGVPAGAKGGTMMGPTMMGGK